MQRPSPLALVDLDFAPRRGSRLLGRPFELLAQLGEDHALIVARRFELFGIRLEPRVCLGQCLALALGELAETGGQPLLDSVEVGRPLRQSLLDSPFDQCQGVSELCGDAAFAIVQLGSARVGELPLLLGQERGRVGPGAGEGPFELRGALGCFSLDQASQPRLCGAELVVEPAPAQNPGTQRNRRETPGETDHQSACGDRNVAIRIEAERHPRGSGAEAEKNGDPDQQLARSSPEERRRDYRRGDGHAHGEADLDDRLDGHDRIVISRSEVRAARPRVRRLPRP